MKSDDINNIYNNINLASPPALSHFLHNDDQSLSKRSAASKQSDEISGRQHLITLPYLQLDPTRPRSRAQMDMFAFSCSCWMQCFVDRVCLQVQDAVKDVTKNIQVEKISHMGYKFD